MRPNRTIFMQLIATLILYSCGSSLPVYEIKEKTVEYNALQAVSDYYNEDAKLGYTVLKDDNFLYVNINSFETVSQLKLLKNGVTIFLDTTGKENETAYLQYPLISDDKVKMDMKALIENKTTFLKQKTTGFGDEILMVNGEDQEYVNRQLNDKGISAQVNVVEEVLYYQIKFPIHLVEANNKSLPSMGIAIKGIKSVRSTQPARIKSSAGGRGSGGRGSSGRGGGRKGGGSKGSTSSQSQPRTQMSGLSKDMKIWFKLDLQQ